MQALVRALSYLLDCGTGLRFVGFQDTEESEIARWMYEGGTMSKHWTDKLVGMNACHDAVEWARGYPSLKAAWKACKRGDWMLWLIGHTEQSDPWSEERGVLVRIAVEGAMFAPPCPDESEVARQWCIDALLRCCDDDADAGGGVPEVQALESPNGAQR